MKITVDLDLTPQEARELLGWPDMSQLHSATIKHLTELLQDGNQETYSSLLKPYLDGSQQAFAFYQKLLDGMQNTPDEKSQ